MQAVEQPCAPQNRGYKLPDFLRPGSGNELPNDIAFLLFALTISLVTMAVALPAVMGRVNLAARRAQMGVILQAAGWALLLASGLADSGGWLDRLLSTLSMAGLAGGLALLAVAFDLWCGRVTHDRMPAVIAVVLPVGYALTFASYPLRVGWANGLLALQTGMVIATLVRTPSVAVGRWRWLLIGSLSVQMVMTATRGVLGALFTESYPTFLTPHPVNYLFAVIANVNSVIMLAAILLAHRDEAARALEHLAEVDHLTGVFNRRAWLARASTGLAVSARYGHPVAVVMIDLDHFKAINDSGGHELGDRVLQFFALALQSAARAGDVVGRHGGEEFCVFMNHADKAAARSFDLRVRGYIAEAAVRELGIEVSYSAGIAMRVSRDDTVADMLRRADATMYRAKAQGRARTFHDRDSQLLEA